ncbi:MAG: hypothetical protein KAJ19_20650 [Gammaproteobacteria bacterium]|nr:hypothetical protein [Gammaproteobacteria bacterium]
MTEKPRNPKIAALERPLSQQPSSQSVGAGKARFLVRGQMAEVEQYLERCLKDCRLVGNASDDDSVVHPEMMIDRAGAMLGLLRSTVERVEAALPDVIVRADERSGEARHSERFPSEYRTVKA